MDMSPMGLDDLLESGKFAKGVGWMTSFGVAPSRWSEPTDERERGREGERPKDGGEETFFEFDMADEFNGV